jgi:hypothetical protein
MLASCVVMAANCAKVLSGHNIAAATSNANSQGIHPWMGLLKEVFGPLSPDANVGLIRVTSKAERSKGRSMTPSASAVAWRFDSS